MKKILTERFFRRDTRKVAGGLLGKFIVRRVGGHTYVLMITETEAYDGFRDKASHARRGLTERNKPMFGEAGHWYVYFTYGMHWMLNVVTGEKGYPAAVLIRAGRYNKNGKTVLINGPARLTKFMKIDKRLNALLVSVKTGLWLEDRGIKANSHGRIRIGEDRSGAALFACIKKSPRIGVDSAGLVWAKKHYRFYLPRRKSSAK